jgi:hypothetical protein
MKENKIMKLVKPFKTCAPDKLTQGFIEGHFANDYVSFNGDFLVAPFNCKITTIRGVQNYEDIKVGDNTYMEGGCGIRMTSIENPALSCVFWHCQTVFPVNVGDIVLQGQPVARMGNTGFVLSGGEVVSYDRRLVPPYPGTHVHITYGTEKEYFDFSQFIDWSIPVEYNLRETIINLLWKIVNIFKK